jgi:hypothetical protein
MIFLENTTKDIVTRIYELIVFVHYLNLISEHLLFSFFDELNNLSPISINKFKFEKVNCQLNVRTA